MNILLIHYGEVDDYPPIKSLITALLELGQEVTIATYDKRNYLKKLLKRTEFRFIDLEDAGEQRGIIGHLVKRTNLRNMLRSEIVKHDIVWTTTFWTAILFRKELMNNDHHVLQMMELQEQRRLFNLRRLVLGDSIKGEIASCARRAWKVVFPEYNRAHIAKAWWGLKNVPIILPNKPYISESSSIPDEVKVICERVQELSKEKKVILYQGYFSAERRLDGLAQAVRQLGEDYCLCIMGGDNDERKRLCEAYPDVIYLGFISAPYHLEVTKLAYLGVLTYFPQKGEELNAIFCAPNKLFEYAYCGLPMIGNDIPGLSLPFEKYGIGVCFKSETPEDISDAVLTAEKEYDKKKENCKDYYESVDFKKLVSEIIEV